MPGYNQVGDIATHTADGRELNVVWDELQAIMADANSRRTVIEGLLARHITVPVEDIVASVSAEELELASEFGEPVGLRAAPKSIPVGSKFSWTDKALRFTWQYLYPDIRSVLLLLIPGTAFLLGFVLCQACTRELGERK
jgi:hypothetical protein